MKHTIKFIFILSLIALINPGSYSTAEEMGLCISQENNYIVQADPDGTCRDGEESMTINGTGAAEMANLTPVATFTNNDECDTEGIIAKIGFDKNGNSELDEDEMITTSTTCAISIAETDDTEPID